MYKVIKDVGTYSNIILMNTETNAELNLGRINSKIVEALEEEGYKLGSADDDAVSYYAKWDLHITNETKDKLCKSAMRTYGSRPIKIKPEQKEPEAVPAPQPQVDAWDVLFGKATY